jgi:hypothetical protein
MFYRLYKLTRLRQNSQDYVDGLFCVESISYLGNNSKEPIHIMNLFRFYLQTE